MSVADNIIKIKNELPEKVKLVAVSKTKPDSMVLEAYDVGQRIFGENKVQDLVSRQPDLPKDIQWHFIGHLQTNKVKFIAPFISMIEAVDRLKVLIEINRQALTFNRVIPCLLQFHIAEEETKFGLDIDEVKDLLESEEYGKMKNISIAGVMGMATFTDDEDQVRREFRRLRNIFRELKVTYFSEEPAFKELSMGMSGDYHIAIEEGSTMVRIGSDIFGERNFH
ncbi:MAG: YggS family pyridoxal phosphate-dependent enzyme [Bacteroidales bacterium]|nr:YggS family pyridoxal phosphate-dependent enzyme [Bacteroidales bacterium]